MPDVGFVNGRFGPLETTLVPVEDRGFQFGDGVYEVIRTYRGVPFRLDEHLARLERSAQAIRLAMPYAPQAWHEYVGEGIRRCGAPECKVYIQLTRGVAPREHHFPEPGRPTAVMTVRPLQPLDPVLQAEGVAAVTTEDLRWGRCDIKTINLLPNVLARQLARDRGVFEAILVRDGRVTEGAVSNVMAVRGGVLVTAPEGPGILSGVTRALVLDLARSAGVPVEERSVPLAELYDADEILLTGTTIEIVPVVRVDGRAVGKGVPGDVVRLLSARFRSLVG